ncbi:MAG: hypothetical protein QM627_01995 [Luteolibacter sp.]
MAPLSSFLPDSEAAGALAGLPFEFRDHLRPLKISALRERRFPLLDFAGHRERVRKGQLLWKTDTGQLDLAIHALKTRLLQRSKRLQRQETLWGRWLVAAHRDLEIQRELAATRQETVEHFRKIISTHRRDRSRQAIRRANQILSHQAQEYRALFTIAKENRANTHLIHRMLEWHQGVLAATEFSVGMEMLNHRNLMDRQLPHELGRLIEAAENARRGYQSGLRRVEARIARRNRRMARFTRDCEKLADLEKDRSLCTLHAPADGYFFHALPPGPLPRFLPVGQVIAYFLPEAPLHANAHPTRPDPQHPVV